MNPRAGNRCVACSGELYSKPAVRINSFRLHECPECLSLTAIPRPTAANLQELHDSNEYFHHPYFERRRDSGVDGQDRWLPQFALLESALGRSKLDGARLLDVGCDTGSFLAASLRRYQVKPLGIDVSHRAVDEARRAGIEAIRTTIEHLSARHGEFDVVTAIDVLEHVEDPEAMLREIHDRLRAGGALLLQTPNAQASIYRLGRVAAKATRAKPTDVFTRLFPPEHVQYFTASGLERLASQADFKLATLLTRPMPSADVNVAGAMRWVVGGLQKLDGLHGNRTLLDAVLVKGG